MATLEAGHGQLILTGHSAAVSRFDEGPPIASIQAPAGAGLWQNMRNFAFRWAFDIKFKARRGVRVVYGDGLEKRQGLFYPVPPDTILCCPVQGKTDFCA